MCGEIRFNAEDAEKENLLLRALCDSSVSSVSEGPHGGLRRHLIYCAPTVSNLDGREAEAKFMFPQPGSHQPAAPARRARPEADDADGGNSLEDAARDEREYVRERLRRELDREPTEDEISDFLRKHTEGY